MIARHETEEKEGLTARVYRDAWAFLREAEACAEEGRRKLAQTYARAAVLHAVAAAEGFLEGVFSQVGIDPGLDGKVADSLEKYRSEVARNPRLGEDWRRLSAAQDAIGGLIHVPGWEEHRELVSSLRNEIRKRMLDLAIEHRRENLQGGRLAKDLSRLTDLRSAIGKRALKAGPLAKRWFEGATGLAGSRARSAEGGEDTFGDFQRIVLRARGQPGAQGGITVEEARLACGAVRSMIASVCGAAGREVPRWVREIHDRL
ncbi:MAG: hypothetical protein ACE5JS_16050 [Nitrospinota bacterium]